jgi:hypothetical protein
MKILNGSKKQTLIIMGWWKDIKHYLLSLDGSINSFQINTLTYEDFKWVKKTNPHHNGVMERYTALLIILVSNNEWGWIVLRLLQL